MKCTFCGSRVEKREVTFIYDLNGEYFFIEHVPAEVCVQCGEKTYSLETTDALLELAQKKQNPVKMVQVPVFDYAGSL